MDWEDVERISKACLTFLNIIRIELTSHFGIEKSSRTRCQEKTFGLQSLPIPVHELRLGRNCLYHGKATSYDSTLVVECRYQLMHPDIPDSIIRHRDSVFTSKFWCPRYHFRARLRLPITRLKNLMTACRKNLQHWLAT